MSDLPANIIDSLNNALTITSQANANLSKTVTELTKQRDELLAALNREAQSQHESGYEINPWITDAIASVRSSDREPDSKGGVA